MNQSLVPFAVAGLACFAGAVASLVAVSRMAGSQDSGVVAGVVAGLMIRLAFAMFTAIMIVLTGLADRQVAGGWVLYWYLIFLVVEVAWLARQFSAFPTTQEAI
ncbi:MAG: hypothetical protein R3C05_24755 [Pirellulaceae bacterium]